MSEQNNRLRIADDVATAWLYYSSGETLAQVGERYNVTREYVRQVFARAGYKMRARSSKKRKVCRRGHVLGVNETYPYCKICKELRALSEYRKKVCRHGHPKTEENVLIHFGKKITIHCKICSYRCSRRYGWLKCVKKWMERYKIPYRDEYKSELYKMFDLGYKAKVAATLMHYREV